MSVHGWQPTRSARFTPRELAAIGSAKQGTYFDEKPFLYECGQEVIIVKPTHIFYMQVAIVKKRWGGSPATYVVSIGAGSFPILEPEITAYRALPVPLWITQGKRHQIDRVLVFGLEFPAGSKVAARLMKRQGEHNRRQAAKRIHHDTICLPKWTQTTAQAAVAPLVSAARRAKVYRYMNEYFARGRLLKAA